MKRLLAAICAAAVLAAPVAASADSVFLSTNEAGQYMRLALQRRFGNAFVNSYARRVKCHRRVARGRIDCVASWVIGDSSYAGIGQIWVAYQHHVAHWNYAYRIRRFDEYCAIVERDDHCIKTFIVN
jgi:hypothetical protein